MFKSPSSVPLQRQRQVLLTFPVLCLLAALILFGVHRARVRNVEYWVRHTQQVQLEAQRLMNLLLEAETGFRGYFLLRRPDLLAPPEIAIKELPKSLNRLEHLVSDNLTQVQRVQQIRPLINTRIQFLQQNLSFVNARPDSVSQIEFRNRVLEGKRIMDQATVLIDTFINEEERLQTLRNAELAQQSQITWLILIGSAVVGIGGTVILAHLIHRLEQQFTWNQQELATSEKRYRLLLEHFPNGMVYLVDRNLRHLVVEGRGWTYPEVPKETLVGKTLGEVFPPEITATIEPFYQRVLAGELVTTEMSFGGDIYEVFGVPIRDHDNEILGAMALTQLITEQKVAQQLLQQANEELEARVAERTLELAASHDRISLANAELARAARLKDEFLAGMSHELRTPLNAILGLSEALIEEVYGSLTPEQTESLQIIENSGEHLLALINDILDLSKIASGKMDLQLTSVPVVRLCESSLNFVKQLAHQKQIQLHCQIPPDLGEIEVDERRVQQALVNLLSNAVKFTPVGGSVRLQVDGHPLQEVLDISVIDTGIGIAPDNLARLFQPFVQLDSSLSRQYAGTGLGLALVRRIAELHGGSIALDSELGKGSQFTLKLPWKGFTPPSAFIDDQTELALPEIERALIVEDSTVAANQLVRYLEELEAEPIIHPQATGAFEVALEMQPTVIILDLLLPDQSGWDVLAALKADTRTRAIPVVIISVVDERSRSRDLGASGYLLKPISREDLQATLKQILGPTQSTQQPTALVVATDPGIPIPPRPPEQPHSRSPVILLAEDHEGNIELMQGFLRAKGFQVILARDGLEAVQAAEAYHPDLILMDIQMPNLNGLEATQQIRNRSASRVPIIALTALAMPGDRDRCLAAGANEYMTKPVSLRQLMKLISQYLPNLPTQS